MEIGKLIRESQNNGKLLIGSRSVMKSIRAGKVTHVIFASNCPEAKKKLIEVQAKPKAESLNFGEDSIRLGETCGKPFTVLVVGIKK
jgi:large subunit ribosomal protein L30e